MSKKLIFKNGSLEDFAHIYQDMRTQFPHQELKTKKRFKELLETQNYKLYLAYDGKTLVGYVYFIIYNNCLWVDYVAVLKKIHCNGYGKEIFEQLKSQFNIRGYLLEVEKPDQNEINTIRRIDFYKKMGAEKIDIDYFYPNENGNLPLDLYFMPFDKSVEMVTTEEIFAIIKYVFFTIHSDIENIEELYLKIKPV